MKNYLAICLMSFIFSCSHGDFVADIDFKLYKSSFKEHNNSIKVIVIDDRIYKMSVGRKAFGSKNIDILSEQDLEELLENKITKNLLSKGFQLGNDFIIEVLLEEFEYQSKRGFPKGHAEGHGKVKIIVTNNKNGKQFSKTYKVSDKNSYFIVSSIEDDKKNINALMQELISDFLVDQEFLLHLGITSDKDSSMERLLRMWYMLI